MLEIIICVFGILAIIEIGEWLWSHKILKGEYLRKFVHISTACFIASWPWFISWPTIQILGAIGILLVLLEHWLKKFHLSGNIARHSYGDVLFPTAILICASLTQHQIFFALAILHMALADGLAAVVGEYYHRMRYKVFGDFKSVYGTMTFCVISLAILAGGIFGLSQVIPYNHYVMLLLALPPVLTIIENISIRGFDNLTVPIAVVLALRLAA